MQDDSVHTKELSKNVTLFMDHTAEPDGSEVLKINSTKSHLQQLEELTYEYHRALNKIEVSLSITKKVFNMHIFLIRF